MGILMDVKITDWDELLKEVTDKDDWRVKVKVMLTVINDVV